MMTMVMVTVMVMVMMLSEFLPPCLELVEALGSRGEADGLSGDDAMMEA